VVDVITGCAIPDLRCGRGEDGFGADRALASGHFMLGWGRGRQREGKEGRMEPLEERCVRERLFDFYLLPGIEFALKSLGYVCGVLG